MAPTVSNAGIFFLFAKVGSLALMVVVTWSLARAALTDLWAIGLMLASAALLLRYKVNSAWLVLAGGVLGNVVHWLR